MTHTVAFNPPDNEAHKLSKNCEMFKTKSALYPHSGIIKCN